MKIQYLLLTAGLASGVQSASAADVTGKVLLKGTPKAELTIDMASDPKCGALHSKPITTRHYVVGAGSGLANVFVYVKSGAKPSAAPPSDAPLLLDQVGCEYMPYVAGVQVNQKFKIKNSDPTMHNVHPLPTANKEFNFAQPTKEQVNEKAFDKTEVAVKFKCDVHAWMFAYVGVVDHPYFAVTDKDGNFKISGLPNGKYTLEAYHPKTHGANPGIPQEITVDADKKVEFTIELK